MSRLSYGARVKRKLRYKPFWENLADRAWRSGAQAVGAYVVATGFHVVNGSSNPYGTWALVFAVAAGTSVLVNGVQTAATVHNLPVYAEVVVSEAKTFVAAFVAALTITDWTIRGVGISVEHAADVAAGAAVLAAFTVIQTVRSAKAQNPPAV